jgi:hypothetical protein
MKTPTVKTLVAVNNFDHLEACTLCFKSLRVGWPTADIHVYVNGGNYYGDIECKLNRVAEYDEIELSAIMPIHHAEWIRSCLYTSLAGPPPYKGPLVIADPDIVYWKSCEGWEFEPETLLAGHYNPRMWNDFAKCVSVPRIHTHMMVFPDIARLAKTIRDAYPWAFEPLGEFCEYDPFKGRVMFESGRPIFWDNCSNLYQMLAYSGKRVKHFDQSNLQCYDHLNSASYHDLIISRLSAAGAKGYDFVFREWVKNPTPNIWHLIEEYYREKAMEAIVAQPSI